MTDRRIIDLQEGLSNDAYLLTDSVTNGTKKYAVSDMIDRAADTVLNEVGQITSQASSAAAQAADAKNAAQAATTAANNAATAANNAATAANAAIDAIGDISEQAVPLMSADTRGGAMLGDGLAVEDGALSIGDLVKTGNPVDGCALHSVNAQGWAEQRSTTGKNLFRIGSGANMGVTYRETSDGLLVTGTSTGAYAGISRSLPSEELASFLGNTYTLSCDEATIALYPQVGFTINGSTRWIALTSNTVTTFTVPQDATAVLLGATVPQSGTTLNTVLHIQLEAGSTATSYEPYTGGKPSPSPDYPQEIKVARGRNLVDWNVSPFSNALNILLEPGDYVMSAAATLETGPWYIRATDTQGVLLTKDELSLGGWSTASSAGIYYGAASNSVLPLSVPRKATVEIGKLNSNGTIPAQLERGSTATPYVPYGHVGLEVQGRNLLNYPDFVNSSNSNTRKVNTTHFWLDAGTYTLSKSQNDANCQANLYKNPGNVMFVNIPSGTQSATFTINERTEFTGIELDVPANSTRNIQIEAGSTAHDYEPYYHETRAIPLPLKSDGERWAGGLPDGTADALSIDSAGKWEWGNATSEVLLDGSTTAANSIDDTRQTTQVYFSSGRVPNIMKAVNHEHIVPLIASSFVRSSSNECYGSTIEGLIAVTPAGTVVLTKNVSSTQEANTWLASNPVTVLYPLATPTTESGYIDPPKVVEGCTVDIPELSNIGVKWYVKGASSILEYVDTVADDITTLVDYGSGKSVKTKGCALRSVEGAGRAEQASTTGKNLLPNTATSQTINGVTFAVNPDKSITLSGTSTSSSNLDKYLYGYWKATGNLGVLSPGGTYTASFGGGTGFARQIYFFDSEGGIIAGAYQVITDSTPSTFTVPSNASGLAVYITIAPGATVNATIYPQLEAGSTATSYEPYSGGKPSPSPDYPQEIKVARGRNLLEFSNVSNLNRGYFTYSKETDDAVIATKNTSGGAFFARYIAHIPSAGAYTLSIDDATTKVIYVYSDELWGQTVYGPKNVSRNAPQTLNFASAGDYILGFYSADEAGNVVSVTTPQLEQGSTPTPYVPYGHVGLEVRNPTTQAIISTTPIPLPAKGFAASLPDGTCDTLSLDSAGGYEWGNETDEVVFDGSNDENWESRTTTTSGKSRFLTTSLGAKHAARSNLSGMVLADRFTSGSAESTYTCVESVGISTSGDLFAYSEDLASGTPADFKTWLSTHNVTVLYPLATPTIEHGYINLPDLPEGATVTIPELKRIGIKWFVSDARELVEHAANWGKRNQEMESRIEQLEIAIAALATS